MEWSVQFSRINDSTIFIMVLHQLVADPRWSTEYKYEEMM